MRMVVHVTSLVGLGLFFHFGMGHGANTWQYWAASCLVAFVVLSKS